MATDANAAYSSKDHNYTMLQAFEWYTDSDGGGKHWNRIAELAPELSSFGITAMWLPPPTKADSLPSVGYDIYDLYDLGEFNRNGLLRTHWGTKDELIAAVKIAQDHGIITYVDAVLNHRFGADAAQRFLAVEVANDDRDEEISDWHDIEGWTALNFPARGNQYSDLKWTFNHFTGVDYDQLRDQHSIFRIHGDGKNWAQAVDRENKNYDYLMGADIDHSHPEARDDIIKWGKWIINEVGACGFRFDAVKHIDRNFIANFIKTVRSETDKTLMFAVGEFWKDSIDDLAMYIDALGTQFSLFDVPLHYNFKEAGDRGRDFDMRSIWDGTVVQRGPLNAVTFVDNHDTQPGQGLQSWVSPAFKPLAYALILLRPSGYPCVFWGDLYGITGNNPQQPVSQLADFVRARMLFAYGDVRDYWDHPNCVGWVRTGEEGRDGCAVVMCNGDEGWKRMEVGTEHANETWTDVLGWYPGEVVIGEDGWGVFRCPAMSVSIWAKNSAIGREEFPKK